MKKKDLLKSGPSSEELRDLDLEVQALTREYMPSNGIDGSYYWPFRPTRHIPVERQLELYRSLQGHIIREKDEDPRVHAEDKEGRRLVELLVVSNSRLIISYVRKAFPNFRRPDMSDACQSAAMWLEKGILRFDPERGVNPATYLYWYLRATDRDIWKQLFTIKVSQSTYRRMERDGETIPRATSYHAMLAPGNGQEPMDEGRASFMTSEAPSPEASVMALEAFLVWRDNLRRDLPAVMRKHGDMRMLMFSLVTGCWRYPHPPQGLMQVAKDSDLTRGVVINHVRSVMRTLAHLNGLKRTQFEPVLDALVEYSLTSGIPL